MPGFEPPLRQLFFLRFLRFFVQFFLNARNILSIIPSTAGKIAGKTVQPAPALYNLPKLNELVLTLAWSSTNNPNERP